MELVVLDYETYFDDDYTLKKLSTSEYIKDPRFESLSLSVLRQSEGFKPRYLRGPEIAPYLATLPWSNLCLIAHHMHFDGAITAWHYGHVPARYFCTISASQAWNKGAVKRHSLEALSEYYEVSGKQGKPIKGKRCADLTEAEWAENEIYNTGDTKRCLYFALKLMPQLTEKQLELMDLTIRMFTQPVLQINVPLAEDCLKEALEKRERGIGMFDPSMLRSKDKFAQALRDVGVEPPLKISPRTGKETYAFAKKDEEFIELLDHPDQQVRDLVEAKLEASSSIDVTRAERMIWSGNNGGLPVYLKYATAQTDRWGGGDKRNLQNFKSKRKGGRLRQSIIAPPGYLIGVADAAQIEPRMNAWHAGQQDLLDMFARGEDTYNYMATEVFGRPIDRKKKVIIDGVETYPDEVEGFVGKQAIIGLGYFMGAQKFQYTLKTADDKISVDLPLEQCQHTVNVYRTKNYKIAQSWQDAKEWLIFLATGKGRFQTQVAELDADEKRVWFPNGTSMVYPGITLDENGDIYFFPKGKKKYLHGGLFIENFIQKLSCDAIGEQMLEIKKHVRITSMSHDEVMFLIPKSDPEGYMKQVLSIMATAPSWAQGLPLKAEGGYDECYSK